MYNDGSILNTNAGNGFLFMRFSSFTGGISQIAERCTRPCFSVELILHHKLNAARGAFGTVLVLTDAPHVLNPG